jgi:hypothetical protein
MRRSSGGRDPSRAAGERLGWLERNTTYIESTVRCPTPSAPHLTVRWHPTPPTSRSARRRSTVSPHHHVHRGERDYRRPRSVDTMPSSRRIVCRASRISPWRAASRIFAGASRRVIELVRTTGAEMPRPSRPYLWDGRRLIVCGRRDRPDVPACCGLVDEFADDRSVVTDAMLMAIWRCGPVKAQLDHPRTVSISAPVPSLFPSIFISARSWARYCAA